MWERGEWDYIYGSDRGERREGKEGCVVGDSVW